MRTKSFLSMKSLLLCALLVVLSLAGGCVSRYDVTLANQRVITSHGKPKLHKESNTFRFKDAQGNLQVIPVFNVSDIKPR